MAATDTTGADDPRIRALFNAAGRAAAEGRGDDAARLLRQAEQESPRHPLVRNEIGQRLLRAGDPVRAREQFELAARDDGANAALWINLAASLRSLERHDEELRALDRALTLEPDNLRALLQKASAQELRQDARAAAVTYRRALQSVAPDAPIPPWMREVLAHAAQVVESNNRALESFLEERIAGLGTGGPGLSRRRFDRCLSILMQRTRIYQQQPTFLYFPELAAIEFHDRADFPWLDAIEAATDDIRAELLAVMSEERGSIEPYLSQGTVRPSDPKWRELNQSRRWSVFYLWREGVAQAENLARCPRTAAALEAWPRCEIPGSSPSAVFSILDAKTRIPPHTGVNNTRLLVHLPLVVPPGCGFRVGGTQREWVPGQAFVFDDTIEHEAWNGSEVPRAVMIFDIWNPAVSAQERAMVGAAVAGMSEWYGRPLLREDGR
jgi:aspartyl/asparaginyl beta-hydroxylase (cupin superfamily)